jgi:hypothetical protein
MSVPGCEIKEITSPQSPHLPGLEKLQAELFPGVPSDFTRFLRGRSGDGGRLRQQLFAGLVQGEAAGLLQVLYREWGKGLIANVDRVGVRPDARGTNLGLSLLRFAKDNFYRLCLQYGQPALGVVGLTDPDRGPADSWSVRRVRLFEKLGAQIRRDLAYHTVDDARLYPEGKLILWYPLTEHMTHIGTRSLAWILWQISGLAPGEFVKRYGNPPMATEHYKS